MSQLSQSDMSFEGPQSPDEFEKEWEDLDLTFDPFDDPPTERLSRLHAKATTKKSPLRRPDASSTPKALSSLREDMRSFMDVEARVDGDAESGDDEADEDEEADSDDSFFEDSQHVSPQSTGDGPNEDVPLNAEPFDTLAELLTAVTDLTRNLNLDLALKNRNLPIVFSEYLKYAHNLYNMTKVRTHFGLNFECYDFSSVCGNQQNQTVYIELLKWLGVRSHSGLGRYYLNEVASLDYRLVIDFDSLANTDLNLTHAECLAAERALCFKLARCFRNFFKQKRLPLLTYCRKGDKLTDSGLHVVFRDVIVPHIPATETVPARHGGNCDALRLFLEYISNEMKQEMINRGVKLDTGPTKTGTLKLPFMYDNRGTSPDTYSVGFSMDDEGAFTEIQNPASLIVSCSILAVSQARYPIRLSDLPITSSFVAPRTAHITFDDSDFANMEVENTDSQQGLQNDPPEFADSTKPKLVNDILTMNATKFGSQRQTMYEFADDFSIKGEPPRSAEIMCEIEEQLNQYFAGYKTFGSAAVEAPAICEQIIQQIMLVMDRHFAFVRMPKASIYCRSAKKGSKSTHFVGMTVADFRANFSDIIWNGYLYKPVRGQGFKWTATTLNVGSEWLGYYGKRSYDCVVFSPYPRDHPEACQKFQFNMWHGWKWNPLVLGQARSEQPVAKSLDGCHRLQQHIYNILCNGDDETFQWFMSMVGCKIIRPWFRPDCTVVLQGEQGCGKTFLFEEVLKHFMDPYFVKTHNIGEITGQFNELFKNKLLILCDEFELNGDPKLLAATKGFVTSSEQRFEQKYQNAVYDDCYAMLINATNDSKGPTQGSNERRFVTLKCRPFTARGRRDAHKAYFAEIAESLKANNMQGVKIWISQFYYNSAFFSSGSLDAYGNFGTHSTPEKCLNDAEKKKVYSLSVIEKFWDACLARGYSYHPKLDWALNSSDPLSFCFSHRAENNVQPEYEERSRIMYSNFSDGRKLDHLNHGEVIKALTKSIDKGALAYNHFGHLKKRTPKEHQMKEIMVSVKSPVWDADQMWLSAFFLDQVYHEFVRMHRQLQSTSGNSKFAPAPILPGKASFIEETGRIFSRINDDTNEPPPTFTYTITARAKGVSSLRSAQPRSKATDKDWREMLASETTDLNANFTDSNENVMVLGDLDTCRKAFFLYCGIDHSPDRKYYEADRASKEVLFDKDWCAQVKDYFHEDYWQA